MVSPPTGMLSGSKSMEFVSHCIANRHGCYLYLDHNCFRTGGSVRPNELRSAAEPSASSSRYVPNLVHKYQEYPLQRLLHTCLHMDRSFHIQKDSLHQLRE